MPPQSPIEAVLSEHLRQQLHRVASTPGRTSTASRFISITASLSPPPAYSVFVVRPDIAKSITAPVRGPKDPTAFLEIPVITKEGQSHPCFAFRKREHADAYLSGQISEQQLLTRHAITPGKPSDCQTTH